MNNVNYTMCYFIAERRKKLRGGQSPLQDETSGEGADGEEGEDYMDEGMRVVDADALARISQIIAEHAADLEMAQVAPGNLHNFEISSFACMLDV